MKIKVWAKLSKKRRGRKFYISSYPQYISSLTTDPEQATIFDLEQPRIQYYDQNFGFIMHAEIQEEPEKKKSWWKKLYGNLHK